MGASEYMDIGKGRTAQEAFSILVEQAEWEHGHGGYSGTIAEKRDFVEFARPKGMHKGTVVKAIRAVARIGYGGNYELHRFEAQTQYPALPIAAMAEVYNEKWGPSLAIELSKGNYLFAGLASS